jgi:uncharacterized membrane protein
MTASGTKPLFNTNAKKNKSCLPQEASPHGLDWMATVFILDLIIGVALIVSSLPFLDLLIKGNQKKVLKGSAILIVLLTLVVLIAGGIAIIASTLLGT